MKNVAEGAPYRKDFGATVITSAAQRQFYRYGKFALGTDVTYDGSTGARLDEADTHWRADAGQRWSLGTYGGYEHVIGRFGAILQLGYYVARGFDNPAKRGRISDSVGATGSPIAYGAQFAIRSTGGLRGDALEFGAGYRMNLPWSKVAERARDGGRPQVAA